MRNALKVVVALVVFCFLVVAVAYGGELDSFISHLNVQAGVDLGGFKAKLSAQFGVSSHQVEVLFQAVDTAADAYMCLRVAQLAGQPADAVMKEYRANKNKGWGVIAKNLGIKPGSKEFHALKNGKLGSAPVQDKGKGKRRKG